jgi:hypothetical protein
MRNKKLALFCICALLLLSSCKTPIEAEKTETEKYNAYIELLNFQTGWFAGVTKMYFSTFGDKEELEVKKNFNGFTLDKDSVKIYEIHNKHTAKPRKYLDEKPSYGEADVKMRELCDKFDAFVDLYLRDVNAYYTNKEYEQDNFVKGRQFHKQMLADYAGLNKSMSVFVAALSPKMLEKEEAELPSLKEQGYMVHYYALSTLLDGKKIMYFFQALGGEGDSFLQADPDKYQKLYDSFNTNVEALKVAVKDEAQMKKEGYTAMNSNFLNQFIDTTGRMQTAATDTLNMIKAGTTQVDNELTGKATTGGINNPTSRFNDRLNTLIGNYNQSIK